MLQAKANELQKQHHSQHPGSHPEMSAPAMSAPEMLQAVPSLQADATMYSMQSAQGNLQGGAPYATDGANPQTQPQPRANGHLTPALAARSFDTSSKPVATSSTVAIPSVSSGAKESAADSAVPFSVATGALMHANADVKAADLVGTTGVAPQPALLHQPSSAAIEASDFGSMHVADASTHDPFTRQSVQQTLTEAFHEPRKVPPVTLEPGAQRENVLEYIKQQLDCYGKEPLLIDRYQLLGPDHRATGGTFLATHGRTALIDICVARL